MIESDHTHQLAPKLMESHERAPGFFAQGFGAADKIIGGLKECGLEESDLHVIANGDVVLEPLPEPDITHGSDVSDAAKGGAAIGLRGSIVAATVPPAALTLGDGAILAGAVLGTCLRTLVGVSVCNPDVEEYRDRIERGELTVTVDCGPEQQSMLSVMLEARHYGTLLLKGNLDSA